MLTLLVFNLWVRFQEWRTYRKPIMVDLSKLNHYKEDE